MYLPFINNEQLTSRIRSFKLNLGPEPLALGSGSSEAVFVHLEIDKPDPPLTLSNHARSRGIRVLAPPSFHFEYCQMV